MNRAFLLVEFSKPHNTPHTSTLITITTFFWFKRRYFIKRATQCWKCTPKGLNTEYQRTGFIGFDRSLIPICQRKNFLHRTSLFHPLINVIIAVNWFRNKNNGCCIILNQSTLFIMQYRCCISFATKIRSLLVLEIKLKNGLNTSPNSTPCNPTAKTKPESNGSCGMKWELIPFP